MSQERRTESRSPIRVNVQYHTADAVYEGYTDNISGGGIFVRTKEALPVGTEVTLVLHLPDEHVIEIDGKVVYANPFENTRPLMQGMGIQFRHTSDEQRDEIRRWIRDVAKLHTEGPAFRPL